MLANLSFKKLPITSAYQLHISWKKNKGGKRMEKSKQQCAEIAEKMYEIAKNEGLTSGEFQAVVMMLEKIVTTRNSSRLII